MIDRPLLEVREVSKAFGGVQALHQVGLAIAAGEVHALCGENGAGKSTLIKIISGALSADAGAVRLAGHDLPPGDVRAAEAAGVAVIHQELAAFADLAAAENIFAGHEPRRLGGLLLDRREMRRRAADLLARLGERIDLRRPLGELTVAQRQMVTIARAMSRSSKLLIMDEPTSSLSARETQVLLGVVRQLRRDGVGMLYVTHRLTEVFELSDRVSVMRDGRLVSTRPTPEVSREELIRQMVGRTVVEKVHAARPAPGDTKMMLEVRNLSRKGEFADVSFAVRAGEIVGLGGLVGAGRSELARTIFGAAAADGGQVLVSGRTLAPGSIRDAVKAGLAFVPEDRQHLGLVLPMSVGANLSMAVLRSFTRGGLIDGRREAELARRLVAELGIKTPGIAAAAGSLSGGNQQKVLLGKWLAPRPRVLVLDEPTRGVDVGAKAELHRIVAGLAAEGMAVLLISSETPELLGLCDRVVVMRTGRIVGELTGDEMTEQKVLELALPQT